MKPEEQMITGSLADYLTTAALYSMSPPSIIDRMVQGWTEHRASLFDLSDHEIVAALQQFKDASCNLAAEAKLEIVSCLYGGGTHNGAGFARELMKWEVFWDHPLLASLIYSHWTGGKVGFQFLPDARGMQWEDYLHETWQLEEIIIASTRGDPRTAIVGRDREFFDALPERFTVYRGTAGVTPKIAACGVCWTTRREIAEWFALRAANPGEEPLVVTGRVRKDWVLLALAGEHEVAVRPQRARQIACRKTALGDRPKFAWAPGALYR